MAQHRKTSRTARRVAALGVTSAAALALAAGTASAGTDEECTDIAVCAEDVVNAGDLDVAINILTHGEDDGWGFPPVHLGP